MLSWIELDVLRGCSVVISRLFFFFFKLDKTAEIAMDQIKDRDYYRRYMNSGKKIILIGVNFDKDAGQIEKWTQESV